MTSTCVYGSPSCECGTSVPEVKAGSVKRVVTVALLTLLAWTIGVMALIGVLVTYDRVTDPQEDSGDRLLNCYIYGDGECGPNSPWHGFINLF